MSEKNIMPLSEVEFEELIKNGLSEIGPKDSIIDKVTPWKKYMKYVLAGLFLSVFNNHIVFIRYLGLVISFLGFRGLRRENKWFCMCYIFNIISLVTLTISMLINASIWNENIKNMAFYDYIVYVNLTITTMIYICLWLGIWKVEKKAKVEKHSKSPVAIVIWYLVTIIIAWFNVGYGLLAVLSMVAYIWIFACLIKVYKNLSVVGYAIKPANIKIPGFILAGLILLCLAMAFIIVVLNNNYPMDWSLETEQQAEEYIPIKSHLAELGVPQYVIDDLSVEDLKICNNASEAIVIESDEPVGEGHWETKGNITTFEYDAYELHLTQVALKLEGDTNKWHMINHFKWNINPNFIGTEAIVIDGENIKDLSGEIRGRLLCRDNNDTYISDYYSISKEVQTRDFFETTVENNSIHLGFSFNKVADEYSGYISYDIEPKRPIEYDEEGNAMIWVEMYYYHQKNKVMYPATHALEFVKSVFMFWDEDEYARARLDFY